MRQSNSPLKTIGGFILISPLFKIKYCTFAKQHRTRKIKTMIEKEKTKLQKILLERKMTQADLMRAITKKTGFQIGRDRISKIVNGNLKNYTLETAVMIAESLNVNVDDIVELKEIKKKNFVEIHHPKRMGGPIEDSRI